MIRQKQIFLGASYVFFVFFTFLTIFRWVVGSGTAVAALDEAVQYMKEVNKTFKRYLFD